MYGDMMYLLVFKVLPLTASTNFVSQMDNRFKDACKAIYASMTMSKEKNLFFCNLIQVLWAK